MSAQAKIGMFIEAGKMLLSVWPVGNYIVMGLDTLEASTGYSLALEKLTPSQRALIGGLAAAGMIPFGRVGATFLKGGAKVVGPLAKGAGFVGKTGSRTLAAVSNMGEFFTSYEFGKLLAKASQKTGKQFQGQQVFKVTKKVRTPEGNILTKGTHFYLDGLHQDHIEVFSKAGKFESVFNLNGQINKVKTNKAQNRRINL